MEHLIKKHTLKLSELCFYLFFVSLLFAKGIGLYDGQTGFKIFLIIALFGWAGKMLLTRYYIWEIPLYAALIVLGGAVYLTAREKGALIVILLFCGLKNMELKKVFQVGLATWVLSFGILFLLTSLHIVDSAFKVHDRLGMGRIIRWSLGYAHPNVLHISYLVLVCFLVYVLKERIRFSHLLLLELGNLYVFMYSLSTTGFLVTTICLVLVCYWKIRKRFCRVEQVLIQLCLPVCLFLSFGAPLLLKGRAFDIVNKLLNTRLSLSKWFLQNQSVKLFGVDTASIVTAVRTMDNSYVFALITYGAVFFLFVICVYFRGIYLRTKEQDGIALCVILSCLIAGLTEPFLFNTSFKNLSLLLVSSELFHMEKAAGRQITLLNMDRNIEIPLPDISCICSGVRLNPGRYRMGIAAVAAVGALIAGTVVFQNAALPERYFLPRKAFEYTDDLVESYYFTSSDDIQGEGDRILGYESEQTEMVAFSGNIARVERFRNTVAAGAVSGLLILGVGNLAVSLKRRNTERIQKNEQ
ncbi:MAG: hypothetical protein Q4D94_11120 [Bacillota bacterium]|nr:hypothetical protein [Bacillota bacterium]